MKYRFGFYFFTCNSILFIWSERGNWFCSSIACTRGSERWFYSFPSPCSRSKTGFCETGRTAIPMQKNKSGVWSAISKKMEPDIYTYTFLVDSLSIVDPANALMRSSYNGTGTSYDNSAGLPCRKMGIAGYTPWRCYTPCI